MKVLQKTITEMPKHFTSHKFNRQAIINGYPEARLKNKGLSSFLKKYANNDGLRSKHWTKIDFVISVDSQNKNNQVSIYDDGEDFKREKVLGENSITDEQMIQHLKSKGYKIMKPINEWLEC